MKVRKLLAGFLSAAMVLATMTFPVFAANEPYTVNAGNTLDDVISQINTSASGDVVINLATDATFSFGARTQIGNENTESITIDGGNHVLNLIGTDTDWSSLGNAGGKLVFKNVTINKTEGGNGAWNNHAFNITSYVEFDNVTVNNAITIYNGGKFNNTNFYEPEEYYTLYIPAVNQDVVIENCKFEATNGGRGIKVIEQYVSEAEKETVDITVTGSTFKTAKKAAILVTSTEGANITASGNTISDVAADSTNLVWVDSDASASYPKVKVTIDGEPVAPYLEDAGTGVACIGNSYYMTLEEALAAAQADDTITLLANAEPRLAVGATVTKATTIDLNGKTLTINSYNLHFGKMTFKNGTINVGAINASKDGVFWQWDPDPLTFDNVTLNANEVTSTYLISENNGSDINIINGSVINVNPQTQQKLIVFCFNGGGSLLVDNSEINISNVDGKGILYGNITIKGDSEVNIATTKEGIQLTQDTHSLKIEENAVVTVANPTDTEKTRNAIQLAAGSAYSKADTATVNAVVDRPIATDGSNIAKSVKLAFEATEDANVYDIYVVPTDSTKAINRLSTAEMTFDLDADTTSLGMTFDITGADNVNVQRDENDHVLFNFNGVNQADASGVEVKLGKVTFDGYGTFKFTVVPGADNKVQTANINDNIVNTYTPEANTFVLGTGISGEVKVPTQKLTINIDFPNAVNDNVAAYQDMTVTVTGSNYNKEVKLGKGETAMVDGAYKVVIEDELVKDNSYTVTVSGEGYRTARYNVTMTADKTLNFWNNAKNNDAFIEDNEDNSKRKVTFLAGELVRDNQINIYDLSAVVSYFGESNLATTHPEYAKYDLNRDGKIDSRDIAYVLVSWGK